MSHLLLYQRMPNQVFDAFCGDLTVWVNSCPQRIHKLDALKASLEASDLTRVGWEIISSKEIIPWSKTIEEWCDWWKTAASKGKQWVLRIEDDVLVSPHIIWNTATWPALREPDFGVGLLFTFDHLIENLGGVGLLPNGVCYSKGQSFAGGQAQLIRSDLVPKIIDWLWANHKTSPIMAGWNWQEWFDVGITTAATLLGKRTYLHVPSLVNTGELSDISEASPGVRDHRANRTWKPDWKRGVEDTKEFMSEMMLLGVRTRWAVLQPTAGQFVVKEVLTPAGMAGNATSCTINGRGCVLRTSCIYDTQQSALRAAAVQGDGTRSVVVAMEKISSSTNQPAPKRVETQVVIAPQPAPEPVYRSRRRRF